MGRVSNNNVKIGLPSGANNYQMIGNDQCTPDSDTVSIRSNTPTVWYVNSNYQGDTVGVQCCHDTTSTDSARTGCQHDLNFAQAEAYCAAQSHNGNPMVLCSGEQMMAGARGGMGRTMLSATFTVAVGDRFATTSSATGLGPGDTFEIDSTSFTVGYAPATTPSDTELIPTAATIGSYCPVGKFPFHRGSHCCNTATDTAGGALQYNAVGPTTQETCFAMAIAQYPDNTATELRVGGWLHVQHGCVVSANNRGVLWNGWCSRGRASNNRCIPQTRNFFAVSDGGTVGCPSSRSNVGCPDGETDGNCHDAVLQATPANQLFLTEAYEGPAITEELASSVRGVANPGPVGSEGLNACGFDWNHVWTSKACAPNGACVDSTVSRPAAQYGTVKHRNLNGWRFRRNWPGWGWRNGWVQDWRWNWNGNNQWQYQVKWQGWKGDSSTWPWVSAADATGYAAAGRDFTGSWADMPAPAWGQVKYQGYNGHRFRRQWSGWGWRNGWVQDWRWNKNGNGQWQWQYQVKWAGWSGGDSTWPWVSAADATGYAADGDSYKGNWDDMAAPAWQGGQKFRYNWPGWGWRNGNLRNWRWNWQTNGQWQYQVQWQGWSGDSTTWPWASAADASGYAASATGYTGSWDGGVTVGTTFRERVGDDWRNGVVSQTRWTGTSWEYEVEWQGGSQPWPWVQQADAQRYAASAGGLVGTQEGTAVRMKYSGSGWDAVWYDGFVQSAHWNRLSGAWEYIVEWQDGTQVTLQQADVVEYAAAAEAQLRTAAADVSAGRCDRTCVGLHFANTTAAGATADNEWNAYRPVCGNEGCATSGAVFVGLESFGCDTDSDGWAGQECCNVRSCDPTDPAYNQDAGTDMSLNKNQNAKAFCAEGYILVNSTHMMADGASWDSGDGLADDNNASTADAFYETCEKCEAGFSSAGGTSRTCHRVSGLGLNHDNWATCTHMGCELETAATKACTKHSSANPHADMIADTPVAIAETECRDWNTTSMADVKRIKVFHHGNEQAGTSHKCKMTGRRRRPASERGCECRCETAIAADQTTQQAAKAAKDEMYAARAAAQARRADDGIY
jgi:hypothetical protein